MVLTDVKPGLEELSVGGIAGRDICRHNKPYLLFPLAIYQQHVEHVRKTYKFC